MSQEERAQIRSQGVLCKRFFHSIFSKPHGFLCLISREALWEAKSMNPLSTTGMETCRVLQKRQLKRRDGHERRKVSTVLPRTYHIIETLQSWKMAQHLGNGSARNGLNTDFLSQSHGQSQRGEWGYCQRHHFTQEQISRHVSRISQQWSQALQLRLSRGATGPSKLDLPLQPRPSPNPSTGPDFDLFSTQLWLGSDLKTGKSGRKQVKVGSTSGLWGGRGKPAICNF